MFSLRTILLSLSVSLVTAQFNNTAAQNGSAIYKPLFEKHSSSTPVFVNSTGRSANPLITVLLAGNETSLSKRAANDLPVGTCAPGTPCSNGACCSNTGVCSYAPSSCGPSVCISNCDAKAPCGQYADPSNATCPLNVCCSQYGFCGSTDEFCGTGCQAGYGGCGPAPEPSCSGDSTSGRTIGYYESWSTTRSCDKRDPEDLDLTSISHINFAFAFFHPTTFEMMPMNPGDPKLYTRFTALKSKKASLQCFISVGGWSFNDPTNIPNTRTAFSDMVGSAANRRTFINSLSRFMKTYNFDGVDLDWEYPAANDRGGVPADLANYVTFLRELRAAFGTRYGISATIPSSYWYLQGFDIKSMQNYLDWFNFMSYDIHGVWDSTNKFTGPYIRPHTNLTEITQGLDLLWRAGVNPDKVVLGLGWYGRSFTLSDPSCNTPNGVCTFSAGANPGKCTASSGTLSNAEIDRITAAGGVRKGFDRTAAVKWITWDSNQWVSYDDGETMQLKIQAANKLCLSGLMIWALDQDDIDSASLDDLLGIGSANGVSPADAAKIREQMDNATLAADIASSCYWTLCREDCVPGYFATTQSQGQVAGIARDSTCSGEDAQTLCCAPGTTMGTCQWEGWRGVGLPCTPVCSDSSATIVARNTNHHDSIPNMDVYEDQTCNGGYQAYCCSGFIPSSKTNTANLALYGQGGLTKRALSELEERGVKGRVGGAVAGAGICAGIVTALNIFAGIFTFGISLAGVPAEYAACAAVGGAIGYIAGGSGNTKQPPPQNPPPPANKNTGVPVKPIKTYGQWTKLDFGSAAKSTTACDCEVTYTCRYNVGGPGGDLDEVCDNQKWAIDKGLHGATVYNYEGRGTSKSYSVTDWKKQHTSFQKLAQSAVRGQARCQADEFPMGALRQARKPNPQYVRLVNGPANGRQGNDFKAWKSAVWEPCSSYRKHICKSGSPEPPITWEIGQPTAGDRRLSAPSTGSHFIQKYGQPLLMFPTKTLGFRAMNNDPMFTLNQYQWPLQNWRTDPGKANGVFPTDVASAAWNKRHVVRSVLVGDLSDSALYADQGEGVVTIDCDPENAFVNEETGEIVCMDAEDLIDPGEGARTATTTTTGMFTVTPPPPQSGAFIKGNRPTQMPTQRSQILGRG